jgi:hypothetical protein
MAHVICFLRRESMNFVIVSAVQQPPRRGRNKKSTADPNDGQGDAE